MAELVAGSGTGAEGEGSGADGNGDANGGVPPPAKRNRAKNYSKKAVYINDMSELSRLDANGNLIEDAAAAGNNSNSNSSSGSNNVNNVINNGETLDASGSSSSASQDQEELDNSSASNSVSKLIPSKYPDVAAAAAAAPVVIVSYDAKNPPIASNGTIIKSTKLFKCTTEGCTKTFTRRYNLQSHLRCHSGERPFVCKFCPASFSRKHDLRRHTRSLHSADRPHLCVHCNLSFARSDALKRHLDAEAKRWGSLHPPHGSGEHPHPPLHPLPEGYPDAVVVVAGGGGDGGEGSLLMHGGGVGVGGNEQLPTPPNMNQVNGYANGNVGGKRGKAVVGEDDEDEDEDFSDSEEGEDVGVDEGMKV
jgi:hypothetical protein